MESAKEKIVSIIDRAFPVKKREIAILLGLLPILWLLSLLAEDKGVVHRLQRPGFAESEQQISLNYQYTGKYAFKNDISVTLPRQPAKETEVDELLEEAGDEVLQKSILPQLKAEIKKPVLPSSWREIEIKYRISPETAWTAERDWNYFSMFAEKDTAEVEVFVDLKYQEKNKTVSTKHILKAQDFSQEYVQELVHRRIQTEIAGQLKKENSELVLPQKMQGGEIVWKGSQTHIRFGNFFLILLVATLLFSVLSRLAEKERRELNKKRYLRDFNQMLHRLVLLLRCGKSPFSALLELSKEREGYGKEFTLALEKCYSRLYHQQSFESSLSIFHEACPESEIEQFQKLMWMAHQKGDEWSMVYLEQLRDDMFAQRLRSANEGMQKMNSRFIFPMVLFLIIIIILTIFPTFQSGF